MSLATGRFYAFQQLSASEVPMLRQSASFTINPQTGSLTGEYRLVGYLVDMSKKREDDDYNVSQLLTLSSKVEVPRAGGDITFTFQSLSRLTDSITEEMLVNKWVHLPLMGGVNPIETEDQLKDLLERCELVFLDLQRRGCDSPDSVLHEQFENVESNLKMLQKAYLAKVETFPLQQVSDVTAIDDQDLTRPYEDCSFNTLFLLKACRNMDAKEAREALKKKMTALRTDLKAKLVKETPDKKEELRNRIFNLEQNMTYALIEIPVE